MLPSDLYKKWHRVIWSNITEVNAPLELTDIRDILRYRDRIDWIQFYIPKRYSLVAFEETWKLLNEHFFIIRPEIPLRLCSHSEGTFKDISFLKYLPNLKKLILFEWLIEDLTPLVYVTNLESLSISEIKSNTISYAPLSTLIHLKKLHITRTKKDMKAISQLKNLEQLSFGSVTLDSLELLLPLLKLKKLTLMLGGIKNYALLPKIGKLSFLELCWIRELYEDKIFSIAQMPYLTQLKLSHLRYIRNLRWLNGLDSLQELSLDTLNGFESLDGIEGFPNLRKFDVIGTKMKDKRIDPLLQCKNLQELKIPPVWGKTNILTLDNHFPHLRIKQQMALFFEKRNFRKSSLEERESDSKLN